jgi:hypothetical protein
VFLHGIVSQMRETVAQFSGIVVLKAKTQIKFPIEPNTGWIVLLNYYPLTNIEFTTVNYQRILNVLLQHILSLLSHRIIQQIL